MPFWNILKREKGKKLALMLDNFIQDSKAATETKDVLDHLQKTLETVIPSTEAVLSNHR
jgi:hypothetical protein